MFKLHKEGRTILFVTLVILTAIALTVNHFIGIEWVKNIAYTLLVVIYILVLQFFRNPARYTEIEELNVIAPADGKVVIIEEVEEPEFFKDKRIQVSIFMSPVNVHVNRYPISGKVTYAKHHQGKYLVAWHPKSSTLNERTTVVVDGPKTGPVLYRQIAGAVARRIVMYAKEGMPVVQGTDSGFIKFGSRLDLFLPLDAEIKVNIDDKPRGGETVIATLKDRSKA